MSIGEEATDWTAWVVWTIIKWSAIALVFFIAIVVGWLVVLAILPARAGGRGASRLLQPALVGVRR